VVVYFAYRRRHATQTPDAQTWALLILQGMSLGIPYLSSGLSPSDLSSGDLDRPSSLSVQDGKRCWSVTEQEKWATPPLGDRPFVTTNLQTSTFFLFISKVSLLQI